MSGTQYVARSTNVAARMVGDELMIMSGRDSTLFALNGTAALIWEAADGVTPLSEIVAHQICAKFEIDAETALADAEQVVGDLATHGVVRVSPEPITDSDATSFEPMYSR